MSGDIQFTDYFLREVPECLPTKIWAYWDIIGEFMEATTDPAKGEEWLAGGAGYIREYTLTNTNDEARDARHREGRKP